MGRGGLHRQSARIVARSLYGSARGQQLQGLSEVEFAVLGIGVKRVEFFDRLIRRQIGGRKLVGELVDNLARAAPMKQIAGDAQAVELTDAYLYCVTVTIDITRLGGVVELIPEDPVMVETGRRKPHCTTGYETDHHARNKFFHLDDAPLRGGIGTSSDISNSRGMLNPTRQAFSLILSQLSRVPRRAALNRPAR
jgi:hypothetical protein